MNSLDRLGTFVRVTAHMTLFVCFVLPAFYLLLWIESLYDWLAER